MRIFNGCIPVENEIYKRIDEIKALNERRRAKGLKPYKIEDKPIEAPQSPSEPFNDDEPIPYQLTPLGVSLVENGLVVAEIRSTRDFNSYDKWRRRANKQAIERARSKANMNKHEKVNNQGGQISIFDEKGDDIA